MDRYKLEITDSESGHHEFVSDVSASTVDRAMKELIEAVSTESEEAKRRPNTRWNAPRPRMGLVIRRLDDIYILTIHDHNMCVPFITHALNEYA